MIKRKQKTRKRVALAAILSLFLTSAASTITVNAADLNKDSIQNASKDAKISDEQAIAEAVHDIIELFEKIRELKEPSLEQGIKQPQQKEYQKKYIQTVQRHNNAWGALFLLNRLDLLEAAIYGGDADKFAIASKDFRNDIEQTQKEFEQHESEINPKDVSEDAKIISQLRNKNQGNLTTNELTSALFKPDDAGQYKQLHELKQLNEQTQTNNKQIYLWLQIIKALTFKNLTDQQKQQIEALEVAYKSALSNPTDHKEAAQAQKIIEAITQLHANTITKIMIDLGIYDANHQLPYPEIPAVEEILKQTN